MERLALKVVTPEGVFLETEADLVELPTDAGEIGVLAGHLPMVTGIGVGEMRVFRSDSVEYYALAGGFARVTSGTVEVLATFAGAGEEMADIDAACARARQALQDIESMNAAAADAEVAVLHSQLSRLAGQRKQRRAH